MRTPGQIARAALYPIRTRRRALVAVAFVLLFSGPAWYGVNVARASRARQAGERALAAYDFPAARERLQEAARLRPREASVWLLAAQAARRDGDYAAAGEYLKRYEALAGVLTPEGRLEELLLETQNGPVERDVHHLISLADAGHAATEQILEALAVGCIQVYHLDRASFWTNQLLTRFPRNPIGRLLQVQMDDTLNRRERAAAGCRELVTEFPEYTKARTLLATLLYKAQKYAEAAGEYQELLRRRPGDAEPLLGLARCLDRVGRRDEARPLMRELEERHPDNGDVLLECGQFAAKEGRPDDAERLLRRAVRLAPSDYEAHYHLGLCLQQLGKSDESRHHLERFKQIEADLLRMEELIRQVVKTPADPAPRRAAGLICLRNGQPAEGLRWLQGALERAPDDKATNESLADYFQSHGDAERARYHREKSR